MKKFFSLFFVALLAMSGWAGTTSQLEMVAFYDHGDAPVSGRSHFSVVKGPVTMFVGDGQRSTSGHYAVYGYTDSADLTFTSVGAPIVKMEMYCTYGYRAYYLSLADGIDGTWTTSNDVVGVGTTGVWEGNTQFIDFDVRMQVRITRIIFTLAGPVYPNGDVNHDGIVNIADVTALNDYLLRDPSLAPIEADFNNDGVVSIGDVTALIDFLLSGGGN